MRIRNLIPTGGAHTPPGGQECWQISSQWVPERGSLELGHQ